MGVRKYAVRRASEVGPHKWASPTTHIYYCEIIRLADGAIVATAKPSTPWSRWHWDDSWAHAQFDQWLRMGWLPHFLDSGAEVRA